MKEIEFIGAYNQYQFQLSRSDFASMESLRDSMIELAQPEHSPTAVEKSACDYYVCSCGWESQGYWDGFDIAQRDWRDHVYEIIMDDKIA